MVVWEYAPPQLRLQATTCYFVRYVPIQTNKRSTLADLRWGTADRFGAAILAIIASVCLLLFDSCKCAHKQSWAHQYCHCFCIDETRTLKCEAQRILPNQMLFSITICEPTVSSAGKGSLNYGCVLCTLTTYQKSITFQWIDQL